MPLKSIKYKNMHNACVNDLIVIDIENAKLISNSGLIAKSMNLFLPVPLEVK